MRHLTHLICVAFVASVGVWFHAPGAGADSGGCRGDVVVPIGVELRARPGSDRATVALDQPLPPGEYRVTTWSSDTRSGGGSRVQDQERWTVTLVSAAGPVATLGPTADLEDGVEYVAATDDLGTVAVTDAVVAVTAGHVTDEGGGDSVRAECVAFTSVGVSPPEGDPGDAGDPGGEPSLGPDPGDAPGSVDGSGEPDGGPGEVPGDTPPPDAGAEPVRGTVVVDSSALVDCEAGAVAVTVVNEGTAAALVDIAVPRAAVTRAVDLAPGEATTTGVPISSDFEDRDLTIRVLDSVTGGDLGSTSTGVDCEADPDTVAATTLDCRSDEVLVDLVNRGEETARLAVVSPRHSAETVEVSGGSSQRVEIAVGGRDTVAVVVIDEIGAIVLDRQLDIDCARSELSAEVRVDCATGDAIVDATNSGDLDGFVTVWFSDRVLEARVAAGATVSVSSPLAALDHDATVSVLVEDRPILTTVVDDDCVVPSAELDVDCGSMSLDLVNGGEGRADFGVEVLVDGVPALHQRVGVTSGTTTFELPSPEGVRWTIRVTETSFTDAVEVFTGRFDCRVPRAEIDVDCDVGQADVLLGVEGVGTRFVVLVDGVVVDRWTAAADSSTSRALPLDSGAELVSVRSDASSAPVTESLVGCEEDQSGGFGLAASLVAVIVTVSTVAGLAWKGI